MLARLVICLVVLQFSFFEAASASLRSHKVAAEVEHTEKKSRKYKNTEVFSDHSNENSGDQYLHDFIEHIRDALQNTLQQSQVESTPKFSVSSKVKTLEAGELSFYNFLIVRTWEKDQCSDSGI